MENAWDSFEIILLTIVAVILVVRLIVHFVRPVTWQDGEGPLISEDDAPGDIRFFRWSANFWDTLLYYLLPWRR